MEDYGSTAGNAKVLARAAATPRLVQAGPRLAFLFWRRTLPPPPGRTAPLTFKMNHLMSGMPTLQSIAIRAARHSGPESGRPSKTFWNGHALLKHGIGESSQHSHPAAPPATPSPVISTATKVQRDSASAHGDEAKNAQRPFRRRPRQRNSAGHPPLYEQLPATHRSFNTWYFRIRQGSTTPTASRARSAKTQTKR